MSRKVTTNENITFKRSIASNTLLRHTDKSANNSKIRLIDNKNNPAKQNNHFANTSTLNSCPTTQLELPPGRPVAQALNADRKLEVCGFS